MRKRESKNSQKKVGKWKYMAERLLRKETK